MIPGVFPMLKVYSGCDYHRIRLPFENMGFDFDQLQRNPTIGQDKLQEARVVVFNRRPINTMERFKEVRAKFGFKLVMDLDDHFDLGPNHYLYNSWKRDGTYDTIKECLRIADAVTVTTQRLADKIKDYNKNIHVIPNALPYDTMQFTAEKYEDREGRIRFAYIGGASHVYDVAEIKTAVSKFSNESERSRFVLGGYDDRNAPTKQIWTKMENSFTGNKKVKHYTRHGQRDLHSYMDLYNSCDVLLVPLEANSFNQYKSNLKILEAGCKYSACVTSNWPPYSDEPNKDVFRMCSNTREWYDILRYYQKNPQAAKDDGQRLGEYVRQNYNLTKVNEYRKQLFTHLVNS